jgi:hypothetical protein
MIRQLMIHINVNLKSMPFTLRSTYTKHDDHVAPCRTTPCDTDRIYPHYGCIVLYDMALHNFLCVNTPLRFVKKCQ